MTLNTTFIYLFLLSILLSKIFLDKLFSKNTALFLNFIIIFISFLSIDFMSSFFQASWDPIQLIIIILTALNLIVIKEEYNYKNILKTFLACLLGITIAFFSIYYVQYISFGEGTDSILYISEFLNDSNNLFYHFFHKLYTTYNTIDLNSTLVFIYFSCVIFYSLLFDTIINFPIIHKKSKIITITLLSYLLFFISLSVLKFTYINYLWLIFPVNQIMLFVYFEDDNFYSDITLTLSFLFIPIFINSAIFDLILFISLISILELSSINTHTKYKFYLLVILGVSCFLNPLQTTNIIKITIILLFIFIQFINKKELFYYIFTIGLSIYSIISLLVYDVNIYDHYFLDKNHIFIDFINFTSKNIFIIFIYIIALISSLIMFKKTKHYIKPTLLTIPFIINSHILYTIVPSFENIGIFLVLLFNPYALVSIVYSASTKAFKNIYTNQISNAFLALILLCSTSCLMNNIYYLEVNNPDPIYRISEDEFELYEFMYEEGIFEKIQQSETKVNIVSQASNTLAFIPNIHLLNNYSYYHDLLLTFEPQEYIDNLTNIFAIREYPDYEYYEKTRDYKSCVDELKKGEYNLMILRKDQLTNYEYNYAPLYKFFIAVSNFDIIYENDDYVVLAPIKTTI